MKKQVRLFFSAALLGAFANAAIISLNITEAGMPSDVDMFTTDLAGAPGVRVVNWNNMRATNHSVDGTSVKYDSGTLVGNSFEAVYATNKNTHLSESLTINDERFFAGTNNLFNGNSSTLTLTNIPFANYHIYTYHGSTRIDRGGSVTIGSTTFYQRDQGINTPNPASDGTGYIQISSTSYNPLDPSTVIFGNYAVFENLSGSSQTISFAALDMGDTATQRFNINGIQIVEVIPEPSAILLLGIGGVVALLLVRRHKD